MRKQGKKRKTSFFFLKKKEHLQYFEPVVLLRDQSVYNWTKTRGGIFKMFITVVSDWGV